MIFNYTTILSTAPDDGEVMLLLRPEIFITIHGSQSSRRFLALVDTGADHSVFPETIAHQLGIAPLAGKGQGVTAFGGQQLPLSYADVDLELSDGEDSCRWKARVFFASLAADDDEPLLVGHGGFLEFFTATFFGDRGELELVPNSSLLLS